MASMVGITSVSRSYYYLRRRSPGPPFPPDHRQAGERGGYKRSTRGRAQSQRAAGAEATPCCPARLCLAARLQAPPSLSSVTFMLIRSFCTAAPPPPGQGFWRNFRLLKIAVETFGVSGDSCGPSCDQGLTFGSHLATEVSRSPPGRPPPCATKPNC